MFQTATITSKRQLTIPAGMYKSLGFKTGQRVILTLGKHILQVESATALVDRLVGSVEAPARFRNKSVEEIVEMAKKEHFKKQNP